MENPKFLKTAIELVAPGNGGISNTIVYKLSL